MGSEKKNKKKQKTKAEKPAAAAAEVAHNNGRGGGKIVSDPRFASLHSDPRFREAPKKKSKVAIDSRFNRMFTDKNFASSKARIDKRGKQKKDASENKLKHYYRLEDEEEERKEREKEEDLKKKKKNVDSEDEEEEGESESENESEESESEEGESENEELKKKALELKSESEDSEAESEEEEEEKEESDDSSSTSTTDTDEEEEGDYFEEDDTFMQPEEHIPEIEKETHRLAVVNMDWSQVKAVDLYVLLSSFLPKGAQIKSVAVYPSEFGLKRMEEEAVRGPVGLFDGDRDDDDDDDDDEEEIEEKKLRAYELSRLRYYYAVVECDSIATADYLYKTCDGIEFERSSVKLDLRFIPDSMEFKHPPRDVATEAPASYEGLDFQTRALQQSKVHVSWDDDEPQRVKALKRKFNNDQLAELELQEFLASDESETDGDDDVDNDKEDKRGKKHKKQDMYRALLESGNASDGNDDEEDGQDMEVTFNTGLEDLSKRILEKKDKKSATVWEAYLRKRKEKKKAGKNKLKLSSDDESSDTDQEPAEQPDDFFIDESSKGSKGAGKRAQKGKPNPETTREAEATRAELELLLADDNGGEPRLKGYNLKRKKAKGKNGKEVPDEVKIPIVDYDDPRFSALFNSPLFALDPTDPQFKRSAAYVRQVAQKQHKSDTARQETPSQVHSSKSEDGDEHVRSDNLPQKTQKHELSSLARSIKMKSKQVPLPSNTKVPGSQPPAKKRK